MNFPAEVLSQNIAAIITTAIFIWYMSKRDTIIQKSFNDFSTKLEKLTEALNKIEARLHHIENKK